MITPLHSLVLGLLVLGMAGSTAAELTSAPLVPEGLLCEYLINPLGLDARQPRLSWQGRLNPGATSQRQSAYQVLVSSDAGKLKARQGDLWDSGVVDSDQSVHVVYAGKPLKSGQVCHWQVRVRDEQGRWSAWSQPAQWTMGLLERADWQGKWIGCDQTFTRKKGWPPPDNEVPDPWFRKTIELPAKPARATVYVASVGYHELYVNGRKIGDGVLAPAATDHTKRARYVTYEIGDALQAGKNVVGLWLGVSWSIFPPYKTEDKPATPIVIAQAELVFPDGKTMRVSTDETWKTYPSPNRLLGVWDFMHFGGELYDANKEVPGWCEASLDDSAWKAAKVYQPKLELSAQQVEQNRLVHPLKAQAIETRTNGEYRVDMGRNFTGWFEIDVRGKPGQRIDFQFSERPDQAMTHRHFSAYILGPSGKGTFRNRFNYSAARWVTIKGLSEKPALNDVRGWLVRTDYRRAGDFECSDPLLNEIYRATLWTYENLTLGGYVVDCSQRERMGYGGDAHATTEPAMNNYHLGALYTKWAQDWRDVQGQAASWGVDVKAGQVGAGNQVEAGNLPYTAPTDWGGGGPGWSGYCITLPWWMYQFYGDTRILEANFNTIERWLAFLETKSTNNMLKRWGGQWDFLGDWLWPGAKGIVNGDTRETLFFNNCYWIYNLQTAGRIAELLGKTTEANRWRERAATVRKAVHQEFYNPTERSYVNGFQAYLALALMVHVPPDDVWPLVWKRFEDEILVVRKGHFHAGITGGYYVLKCLLEQNRPDLIYTMASKDDYPSWGHMLKNGTTTLWEDWEGKLSLAHSSYLHIGMCFHEGFAGIQPNPQGGGYKKFILRPGVLPDRKLTSAKASFESLYGRITCDWKLEGDRLNLAATVPFNTTATLYLPTKKADTVQENGRSVAQAPGVKVVGQQQNLVVLELGAGEYRFSATP